MGLKLAPAQPIQATATWYAIVGGNDAYWRVEAPAKAVGGKALMLPEKAQPTRNAKGQFNGREPSAFYSLLMPNDDSRFPWRFTVDANDPDYWEIEFPAHEGDAAIWTRPDGTRAILARAMREKLGWRTLAEVDDNYLCDPKLNLFMRSNKFSDSDRLLHLKSLACMSGVVFSTEWLRDRYEFVIRRAFGLNKNEMPELHVCRNNVSADDWPTPVERDGPVRVGWMGSPSHVWDVDLAWPALLHAKNLGCETWMVGYNPTRPWDSGDGEEEPKNLSKRSRRKIAQWKRVGFRHIPWVKPEKFRRMPLPFDVGVAPLQTNDFTLGKSDVKAVEYAISGAAPVLWNNPVYNRDWVHGETCLLVGSPAEAMAAVERLVRDENLRERIVAAAQQYVREERGANQLCAEWGAAING